MDIWFRINTFVIQTLKQLNWKQAALRDLAVRIAAEVTLKQLNYSLIASQGFEWDPLLFASLLNGSWDQKTWELSWKSRSPSAECHSWSPLLQTCNWYTKKMNPMLALSSIRGKIFVRSECFSNFKDLGKEEGAAPIFFSFTVEWDRSDAKH